MTASKKESTSSSSFTEFLCVGIGVIISFITMGIVQESIVKKSYGSEGLKNDLVFFPLAVQTLLCFAISYTVILSRKPQEANLLLNRDLM